jgi:hypothetical protein
LRRKPQASRQYARGRAKKCLGPPLTPPPPPAPVFLPDLWPLGELSRPHVGPSNISTPACRTAQPPPRPPANKQYAIYNRCDTADNRGRAEPLVLCPAFSISRSGQNRGVLVQVPTPGRVGAKALAARAVLAPYLYISDPLYNAYIRHESGA